MCCDGCPFYISRSKVELHILITGCAHAGKSTAVERLKNDIEMHTYARAIVVPEAATQVLKMYDNVERQPLLRSFSVATSLDYALFMSSRYRAELHNGQPSVRALSIAYSTSGRTVLISGLIMIFSNIRLCTRYEQLSFHRAFGNFRCL